jgi:hypothetical protein
MLQLNSLRSRQVGAIHPLYLYSVMSDMSLDTSSCSRRASTLTSQESWTDCDGGCVPKRKNKRTSPPCTDAALFTYLCTYASASGRLLQLTKVTRKPYVTLQLRAYGCQPVIDVFAPNCTHRMQKAWGYQSSCSQDEA